MIRLDINPLRFRSQTVAVNIIQVQVCLRSARGIGRSTSQEKMHAGSLLVIFVLCFLNVTTCRRISQRRKVEKWTGQESEEKRNKQRKLKWPVNKEDWENLVESFDKHRRIKWPVNNEEWKHLLRRLNRHGKLKGQVNLKQLERAEQKEEEEEPNREQDEIVCWYEGDILRVGEKLNGGLCVCEETGFIACP